MTLLDETAAENAKGLFARIARLRKEGLVEQALRLLRLEIRSGLLDGEALDKAGRLVRKLRPDDSVTTRVLLAGQCTTSWLATSLVAVAYGQGIDLEVDEGGYDNVFQDLAALGASPPETRPSTVILLPWSSRLVQGGSTVEDEVEFWKQAWQLTSRASCKLLQVGFDWATQDPLGSYLGARSGAASLVRRTNAALIENLPPGAYFVDLEQVSGEMGRSTFYDMRRYYWTKQPFSEAGTKSLAEHLFAGLRALTTGPKKVLVLDLDNTLWGGVVGELGAHGIGLGESADGEAFRAFQLYCKELSRRGVLLALASKNNPADAHEPFQTNPGMVLSLDDFAAMEIGWEPKGTTIARLAGTLNLGLDSFVFFDDNPAEREQVRQALPEVAVVDVPLEPAEYVRALQKGLWFEAVGLTSEDRARAEQYAVERKRRDLAQSFTTLDDYLRSLEMAADVRDFDEADLPRVVQLLGKTNQFNLTTRRHSQEDVLSLVNRPGAFGITLRVRDKFGDHGLVGLVIAVPDETRPETLRIDTWLMSCRVIARTVEEFQLREILGRAAALGYRSIFAEYIPTKKNVLVADLLDRMGFTRLDSQDDAGGARYLLEIEGAAPPATFVERQGAPTGAGV